jgi:hypothetical protein
MTVLKHNLLQVINRDFISLTLQKLRVLYVQSA